ncbi:MAG: hypothetical protein ACOC7R_01925 [Planctomycetota bacterium]
MSDKRITSYYDAMVYLAGTIAGISVAIVAIFAIFARDQLIVSAYVVAALCVLGLGLGLEMTRQAGRGPARPPSREDQP